MSGPKEGKKSFLEVATDWIDQTTQYGVSERALCRYSFVGVYS